MSSPHSSANKSQHNYIFAAWLVRTFGQTALRQGQGVLDIAGGKGGVSYELVVQYGIPSTLLEVRDMIQLSSMARRRMKRIHRKRSLAGTAYDRAPMAQYLESHNLIPNDDGVLIPEVSLCIESLAPLPFRHISCKFPEQLIVLMNDSVMTSLVQSSSILVGVHPDEATEAIVDAAIHFRIPFAVVPCCLHSNLFPHRVTATNAVVNSYEVFIDYLAAKHINIQQVTLPFEGRSICLYCTRYE